MFPECSLLDVKLHILSSAVFGNEPRLGEKNRPCRTSLWSPPSSHVCVRYSTPQPPHPSPSLIPTSPDYLTRWLQHSRTNGTIKNLLVLALQNSPKCPHLPFWTLPTDNHPAFKSSRWINNQPWWSENSQLNHLLVSVDIKSRGQLHRVHFFPLLNTSPAVWSRKHTKPKAKGERCEIVEDLAWFFAVATGCPVVRLVFDVSETHRSLQWNAYVFIAHHHSKHFRLPDGGGDSDLAFDLCRVNVMETQYRQRMCVLSGGGSRSTPEHKASMPRGHFGCLRVYRGGEIVKCNVCGQSEREKKESNLIRKRACLDEDYRRVWPAEATPGA